MKLTSPSLRIFLLAGIASTGNSWSSIDTATLRYWSPPSTCTKAVSLAETCDQSETTVDINVTLDNTGAACYSNPMQYSSSGLWFSWLGPSSYQDGELNAYSLYVPEGQPVPECDGSGVCDPCDALDPIRGTDPAEWWNLSVNSTIKEMGYDHIAESPYLMGSGCGTSQVYEANDLHPTDFCFPFQGRISIEAGDPYTCVNQDIVSAEACGAACDDEEDKQKELERSVFVKLEDGTPACCECRYYGEFGTIEVCGEEYAHMCYQNKDASSSNNLPAVHIFGTISSVIIFMFLLW